MIATYNVRALFQCGLLENLKQEIERLSINIIRICETRWENNSPFISDGHRGEKMKGARLVLDKEERKCVLEQ